MSAEFAAVARLDDLLGDPWRAENVYGFAAGAARDARGDFPHAFAARLDSVDFPLAYLPPSLGGTLRGLDETLLLVRVAARRDAALMPATLLSCSAVLTVLAAGSDEQAKTVADWVQEGRTIAFALSEEQAGSDVLAGEAKLDPTGDGYRLWGRKWLVGRGATADAVVVVARTAERGPAAFTAVLLGPRELAHRVRRQPAQTVTGMRGIDFADLVFEGTPVPRAAVIGAVGGGLAGAMRAQQVVRLLSTGACLATADTALRTALRFTRDRRVGGVRVADTGYGSRELAVAAAELFAADLLSLTAARYVHLSPATFGLCSSVVKRVATRLTSSSITRSRTLLGARAVLAHGPGAVVDKARRDNEIVETIDTSPFGVLRAIAVQLPGYAPSLPVDPGTVQTSAAPVDVASLFAFGEQLPDLDPAALDLSARPKDLVLLGFVEQAEGAARQVAAGGDERGAELVRELRAALADTFATAAEAQRDRARGLGASAELLDLAERCCLLYAGAAAVLAWRAYPDRGLYGEEPGGSGWLTAVLAVLLALADGRDPRQAAPELPPAVRALTRLDAAGLLFTALPVQLSDGRPESEEGDATS
ncbi:acyl-CoA dehydrogenase family protein [Streptomyces pseudovenezuelae]|uniref:acyl-CoA dehydrogenase family protein n=1 Tax=Streptomyces pseudovenezuelae TaxID=67350 RepID=UPI002473E2F5|nr:acyl-CoA dehydrogenase family protein [Streptomyces pseudovenezuelae]